ncbi:sensor histidine kinase [Altererythrobacter salegens]|uniref:histidine kinase n=1 Tax=Croceibacterium salegens TaxID=1737568 RepID=A0A6I4T095_9SPHN|nr:sensor histidine kinase [Croceibacterium salegens]MXO60697.1 sensor histidine kinase [Croceibacterium salegens]
MLFDDRLATVLRSGAAGERAARTQFRQLLDLLGTTPPGANGPLVTAAYARLAEISDQIPSTDQSRILREPWLRLRNPRLLAHLAEGDPQAAAAAMATARLDEDDWAELIPELPVIARGFLRHRRDLPDKAKTLLARLGVRDLVLPQPDFAEEPLVEAPAEPPAPPAPESILADTGSEGISALVRRIEAFQQARRSAPAALAPRLPLDDGAPDAVNGQSKSCDIATEVSGRVTWATPGYAPLLVGLDITASEVLDARSRAAMRRHQPIHGGKVRIDGVAAVAGEWLLDAMPGFGATGSFTGYVGRLRRPFAGAVASTSGPADRMRQVLHELRTPVNAIQGFAEIIQQQLFGPAPNTYRALSAAVGVDSARLLAGFDEIDRVVRIETGQEALSDGGGNLRLAVERTLKRLEGVIRPRSAKMRLLVSGENFAVRVGDDDAALLGWRILATLAGALAPGEVVEMTLTGSQKAVVLAMELPLSLTTVDDLFGAAAPSQAPAVTAGMFGSGFTLRLARAEAMAAGGSLAVEDETLVLTLPALTGSPAAHSQGDETTA